MQIVIDIDDSKLWEIKNEPIKKNFNIYELANYIYKGTPLPKEHGRLIDELQINKTMEREFKERKGLSYIDLLDIIHFTPTILEAE